MSGVEKFLRMGFYDFGGIIVFWVLWKLVNLKAAIAGTLVFVALDIWRRRRFGIGFPRLYVLTTSLAIVFGVIDLAAKTPFMLKYEGAVSTFIIAVFFAFGARGRSAIEELMGQKGGAEALSFPHARRFFQLLTLTWAFYYFVMSGFYAWVSVHFPYARAIFIRQVASFAGLGVMMGVSLAGRYTWGAFRALGLIPAGPDTDMVALRELRASEVGGAASMVPVTAPDDARGQS